LEELMAVREFEDVDGRQWRAWEIRPEAIHPVTRAEDYLSDCFTVGWLVFETQAGDDKRRLCPYPKAWDAASDEQLRALLAKADKVPRRKLDAERQVVGDRSGRTMPVDVPADEDVPDVTDLHVIRSFKYPGGRLWSVCVIDHPEDGGPPALRFAAGARYLDLRPWPRDWADAPDDRLVELIRAAAPRPPSPPPPGGSRRRYNDPPPGRERETRAM
jgi:hypothetical protein